jgi:hypothetical protein
VSKAVAKGCHARMCMHACEDAQNIPHTHVHVKRQYVRMHNLVAFRMGMYGSVPGMTRRRLALLHGPYGHVHKDCARTNDAA